VFQNWLASFTKEWLRVKLKVFKHYSLSAVIMIDLRECIENLYSPDKVHPVANNENKNNIKLTQLTYSTM